MKPERLFEEPFVAPKPALLAPRHAQQFEDADAARRYHTRPPYPAQVFDMLGGLLP